MSTTPSPSTVLKQTQTPLIFSFLYPYTLSLSTSRNLRSPPLENRTNFAKFSKSLVLSSQPLHDAVLPSYPEDDEEPTPVGDCLVFEEGIFDDPFLQDTQNSRIDEAQLNKLTNNNSKLAEVSPENLIPEKWLGVQKEINITKKERRKLSQELEYGKRVEKRRQALMPLHSEDYEKFKHEKLQQLKPLVLDKPEPEPAPEPEPEPENDESETSRERVAGRVAPRNPRLAVYGGGLEDISAFFSSGNYDPATATEKSQGIFAASIVQFM